MIKGTNFIMIWLRMDFKFWLQKNWIVLWLKIVILSYEIFIKNGWKKFEEDPYW